MKRSKANSIDSSVAHPKSSDGASAPDSLAVTHDFPRSGTAEDASQADPQAARLVEVLDEYLGQLKSGKAPDRATLLAAHPDLAEQLADCLAGLEFIHTASKSPETRPPLSIGDFRIIREVGQGGMGAVYEAEQISLRRRVALKILRFSGVSDPDAIKRFQREAETVARLHHTHIVPIFAVGSERGVNYFAMQFIDGQSLDQVLRDRSGRGERLPCETVAEWGLQAAEALAHAHGRGVIHRDVKPSNLLLDADESRIWLTDFGLAKKLDDVTLSLTGALLGTPRYMSPEQATATHHQIDHRTDIYSLGATLYELLTGKALFRGESPHQVISQILTTEPDPPRRHRPDLPRDLETILMKCLSKDARQRYNSAAQLADDLRAFLDGRPIAARRAGLIERTGRWIKRQKRSVALTAGAVAGTLLLVVFGVAGGYVWQRSRLAFVMLRSDRPPLVAEWVDGVDHVIPPATVPTQNRLEVPAGSYQLRLSSHDRLSQTYDVRLKPGEHFEHKLDLEDQLLWSDVRIDRTYQTARFDWISEANQAPIDLTTTKPATVIESPASSRTDVILFTQDGLQCRLGRTGQSRWDLDLRAGQHPLLDEQTALVWPWDRFVTSTYARGLEIFDDRPMLVSQADSAQSLWLDFNKDGHSDLILATRNQAYVLAIDGQNGEPLWVVARGDAATAATPTMGQVHPRLGAVLYPPQLVSDQDGDHVDDLLATFITLKSEQSPAIRSVELISGATGQPVWRHELPDEDFTLPPSESIPYELRWFHGQGGGYSSGGGGFTVNDRYYLREHPFLERSGPHHYLPTRPWVSGASNDDRPIDGSPKTFVTLMAGRRLVRLDLRNGLPADRPTDDSAADLLEIRPAIQPVAADFDGDGERDLLLLEPASSQQFLPNQKASQLRLAVWSIAKRRWLWKSRVIASLPRQAEMELPLPAWPSAVDTDGDGAAEVLTPIDCSECSTNRNAAPWGTLALLDGRTGEPRWQRQLFAMDQRVEHFIVGPDVDNDEIREIFVATLWATTDSPSEKSLFIDCLSGADGRTVWRTRQPLVGLQSSNSNLWLTSLRWHAHGSDAWPQLIVPMLRSDGETADRTFLFSAGTGQMMHVAMGVTDMESADFDADGVDDLLLFSRENRRSLSQGGILQAVRGVGDEAWRQIPASPWVPVGDLDSDGVRDLVTKQSRRSFEAISGVTGEMLWQTDVTTPSLVEFHASPARPHEGGNALLARDQDLNGDGVADLLLVSHRGHTQNPRPLMVAISGKTGQRLWQSEAVAQVLTSVAWLDCRDLDDDGNPEIVIAAAFDQGAPQRQSFGSDDARLWLVVASGQTGKTQWAEPLSFDAKSSPLRGYRYEDLSLEASYADLNRDGVTDVVLPAQRSPHDLALEMRGISGKNGQTLWRSPLPNDADATESLANVSPAAIGDIDGDGKPEVVVVSSVESRASDGQVQNHVQLELLDGASGKSRWQWKTPADRWRNQNTSRRGLPEDRLRAVLVRRRSGGHFIAIRLWNKSHELHVLDELGRPVSQRKHVASFDNQQNRIWAVDVDGDGDDELILIAQSELMLLSPERLDTPRWKLSARKADEEGLARILGVVTGLWADGVVDTRADAIRAPVVILQTLTAGQSIHGIDAKTGRFVWTCVGPTPPQTSIHDVPADLLNVASDLIPPHVLFQFPSTALVRRGVQVTDLGIPDAASRSTWAALSRRQAAIPAVLEDPRLLRPLPWKPADHEIERMSRFVAWSAFYGITLAVVPVASLRLTLRRRQVSLRSMLAWPPAAAVMIMGMMTNGPDSDFQTVAGKLRIAYFVAGPVLFTLIVFAWWLWQGRWRGIVSWAGVALLVTIFMMALSIGGTSWRDANTLQPGQRYLWEGWYWMAVPVFYLATWALPLGMFLQWLGQRWSGFMRLPTKA